MTRESKHKTDPRFLDLARAISDGAPVIWDNQGSNSPEDTRTLERLRALEAVVSAHRSLGVTPTGDAPTVEATPAPREAGATFVWGPLTVGAKEAQGTRGEVYHAVDESGREVALHLRRADWPVDAAFLIAFREETDRLVGLNHANLLRVLGGGNHAGSPGLWTEWSHGAGLEESLVIRGSMPVAECARVGVGLLAALTALHEAGFAGYGVDASRVLVRPDGQGMLAHSGCLFLRGPEMTELGSRGRDFDYGTLGRLLFRASTGVVWTPEGLSPDIWPQLPTEFTDLLGRLLDESAPPAGETEDILSRLTDRV